MSTELLLQPAKWLHRPLTKVEDLQDAVLGSGLVPTQMSRGSMSGSLLFSERDDVVYTSGLIKGKVSLLGPLSNDHVTLGIGLDLAPGSRLWHHEVFTGSVGIFLPQDEHDSIYPPGAFYAAATLSIENLEAKAALLDLVLDKKILGGTGIHSRRVAASLLVSLRQHFIRMHTGQFSNDYCEGPLQSELLSLLIRHCARPAKTVEAHYPNGYARTVKLARDYLVAHLHEPISIDAVAVASNTSRRTLFRAFQEVLGLSPYSYMRMLRLHRIRHDLATLPEARCTIALLANKWGMSELGRLSGWYRDLFDELPSETRAQLNYMKRPLHSDLTLARSA